MSGVETARLLGEVKVMMQDVTPEAPEGRIPLRTAHAGVKRLERGWLYR
jgi:hypothetical protein